MARVAWSRRSLLDLARLHLFLRSKNPDAAKRAIAAIRQGAKSLESHPEAGRLPDGTTGDIRDLLVQFGSSGYVIRYQVMRDQVAVLAVPHMREAGY